MSATAADRLTIVPRQPPLERLPCAVESGRASGGAVREALSLAGCVERLEFVSVVDVGRAGAGGDRFPFLCERRGRLALEQARALSVARGVAAATELPAPTTATSPQR